MPDPQHELWSMKEQRAYTAENARLIRVKNVYVLATPSGELLVTKVR